MEQNDSNKNRGGKRNGSGRKKLDATMISFRMDNELLRALNASGLNKTDYINKAVKLLLTKDNLV